MTADLDTLRAFFRAAPFMVELGIAPVAVGPGHCTTAMAIDPARHHQHTGQVHAGVSTTLADHTMGAAAQTLLPPGQLALTAELKASLLRAGRGERLVCEARVLKPGRRLVFVEAEVHAEQGGERRLVLKASATMAIVDAADERQG